MHTVIQTQRTNKTKHHIPLTLNIIMEHLDIHMRAQKDMKQATLTYCNDVCNKFWPSNPLCIMTITGPEAPFKYVRKELERAFFIKDGPTKSALTFEEVRQASRLFRTRLSAEQKEVPSIKWLIQRQERLYNRYQDIHRTKVKLIHMYKDTEDMETYNGGRKQKPNPPENMGKEKKVATDHLIRLVHDGPRVITSRQDMALRFIFHHRLGQTYGTERKCVIDSRNGDESFLYESMITMGLNNVETEAHNADRDFVLTMTPGRVTYQHGRQGPTDTLYSSPME